MTGLSFREYLNIAKNIKLPLHSFEDILSNKIQFPYDKERPLQLFKEYLQQGYYPFFKEDGYYIRLKSVLNQTLENDIPHFAQMNISTAQKLKRLLYIVAQSVPFKPNFSKLSKRFRCEPGNFVPRLDVLSRKSRSNHQITGMIPKE